MDGSPQKGKCKDLDESEGWRADKVEGPVLVKFTLIAKRYDIGWNKCTVYSFFCFFRNDEIITTRITYQFSKAHMKNLQNGYYYHLWKIFSSVKRIPAISQTSSLDNFTFMYRFFSARKHGFVDAAVRNSPSDRTAVIALPGGIGTLDEIFEILALIQLQRIGSQLPVPFVVMNYDGYYSKLLEFLQCCEHWGTIAKGEVDGLWKVCETNQEALTYLAKFYNLPFSNET